MAAAWGWWEGPDPLQMFPPSNQAALLTSCSSAFAFQWHRAKRCPYSPCSPCPQPPGEVVSLWEGLVWVGCGGLCAGGSGVLEEQLEPDRGVGSAGAGAALGTGHGRDG